MPTNLMTPVMQEAIEGGGRCRYHRASVAPPHCRRYQIKAYAEIKDTLEGALKSAYERHKTLVEQLNAADETIRGLKDSIGNREGQIHSLRQLQTFLENEKGCLNLAAAQKVLDAAGAGRKSSVTGTTKPSMIEALLTRARKTNAPFKFHRTPA
uniref:Uncharacterized protein n=1 Tax=candidate division WWE3 bacterium TaxID=2053526 RepID=A0A7C4XN17_UNCKA